MNNKRSVLLYAVIAIAVLSLPLSSAFAGEHPGDGAESKKGEEHTGKGEEHPGKGEEHPGEDSEEHKKEHPGEGKHEEHPGKGEEKKEHPGKDKHSMKSSSGDSRAMLVGTKQFNAAQIKTAITAHIKAKVAKDQGVFKINDPKENNKELQLNFVKIHDPVRKIAGKGYFACSDFSVAGDTKGKLYDLDFWLNPKDGKLVVTETKIHKEPSLVNGKYVKKARYTFVNDKPVEVN